MVAGATAGTRQKLSVLTSSSSDVSSDNAAATTGNKITEPHPAQNVRGAVKEAGMCHVQQLMKVIIIIIIVKSLENDLTSLDCRELQDCKKFF